MKSFRAAVTGGCSTRNVELVKTLDADAVIDYTKEEITQTGEKYDLIFDVVAKRSFSLSKNLLMTEGIYVTTAFSLGLLLQQAWTSMTSRKNDAVSGEPHKEHLLVLKDLIEDGKVTSVIDRVYPLREGAETQRYKEEEHAGEKASLRS